MLSFTIRFVSSPHCAFPPGILSKIPFIRKQLEAYFEFASRETNWRTEILAGVTTFLTLAYIVLVNPAILAVTGLLFLLAIVASPFIGIVPPAATAPALILVGSLMLAAITEIHWHDPLVAVPAFLTLILIPFTYSIANRLGFSIIAWAVLHLFAGKARLQDWLLYLLAALFLARFIYLGAS